MDMAEVGGPLSVVDFFTQIWTSQVHSLARQNVPAGNVGKIWLGMANWLPKGKQQKWAKQQKMWI